MNPKDPLVLRRNQKKKIVSFIIIAVILKSVESTNLLLFLTAFRRSIPCIETHLSNDFFSPDSTNTLHQIQSASCQLVT